VDDNGNNAEIDGALLKIVEEGNQELFSVPRNQVVKLWKNGVELDIEDNASGNCPESGGCECYLITRNNGSSYPYCRNIRRYTLENGTLTVMPSGSSNSIYVDMGVTSVEPMDCSNFGNYFSCNGDPDCEMFCVSYELRGETRNFCYPHSTNSNDPICTPNRFVTRFQYQFDTDEYCLQIKECGTNEWTTIECAPSTEFDPENVLAPFAPTIYNEEDGNYPTLPLSNNPRAVRHNPIVNNDGGTNSLKPDYVIGPDLYQPSDALQVIKNGQVGTDVVILQNDQELDRRRYNPGSLPNIEYGGYPPIPEGWFGIPTLTPTNISDGDEEAIIHCDVIKGYVGSENTFRATQICYTCGQEGMVLTLASRELLELGITFTPDPAQYIALKIADLNTKCDQYNRRFVQNSISAQNSQALETIEVEAASPVKAFPNPFTPSYQVDYTLESDDVVSIHIFDLLGNEVMEVKANEAQTAGFHTLLITGADWPQGIYLVKMQFKNHPFVTKRVYKTK
ncbi:MAG: T9SS type A sorting domain-containing protein, partial [Bacteroidota bacterium]